MDDKKTFYVRLRTIYTDTIYNEYEVRAKSEEEAIEDAIELKDSGQLGKVTKIRNLDDENSECYSLRNGGKL